MRSYFIEKLLRNKFLSLFGALNLMGVTLSLNYSNVTPHFDFGIWKVSKGIHRSTNRPVSIWIIDYAIMKERERNKKNRRNYIQFLMEAIQIQQKINHLNVLKIIEVQSGKKKIGFSSEQIETNLSLNGNVKYSRDEMIYIIQQIATTMRYVHDQLHTAFMGIYPENIFLNCHFTLKLGMFIHSSTIQTDLSKITDPFITFSPLSIFHVPCNWAAPETIKNDTITSRADSYMYGLMCVYILSGKIPSKSSSIQSIDLKGPIELCNSIPEEFRDLMKRCLSGDPASRPNFDSITNDDAFSSLVARIFQYIEIIREKTDRDLFNFFKGLKIAISAFSDRIIKQKFMPIFIFYVKKDPRFSYALLPIFFKCIIKYNIHEYIEKVLRPIKPILGRFDNPKVNSLLLDYIGMLLKRIPSEFHEEIVFPIVFAAFNSSDINVVMNALQLMPSLLKQMSVSYIRSDAVPNLLKVADSSQVPDIVIQVVNLTSISMKKTGCEFIAEKAFPVFRRVWNKMKWPKLADALADIIQLCDVPVELLFSTTLQMALLIISHDKVPPLTHARMIIFVQNALQKISRQYKISPADFEAASKYVINQIQMDDNPLKDILEEEEDDDENEESSQNAQADFLNNLNQSATRSNPQLQQNQNEQFGNRQTPLQNQQQINRIQQQQQNQINQSSSSINLQQNQNPYRNQSSSQQNSTSNFQFSNQSNQQQQQQLYQNQQFSNSFDIFNQTPSNSNSFNHQQSNTNSFDIFRTPAPPPSQNQQPNSSFQSFPQYQQQNQQSQVNPYDNNTGFNPF